MKKAKYYVVWKGVKPGIYSTWDECKANVIGIEKAKYKSFDAEEAAKKAFSENPDVHIYRNNTKKEKSNITLLANDNIIKQSIAVDAACSGNPGKMEYRGVWVEDGTELFRVGPFEGGTNNIGEFLAIVHALALTQNDSRNLPIYSDSVNALKWIDKKKCNTKLDPIPKNKEIFDLINRAENWLKTNTYKNPLLKWQTKDWGEIPADFGRK